MIWQTFLLTYCILFASGCPSSPEEPSTTKAPTTAKKPVDDAAGDPSSEESNEPEDTSENTQESSEGDDTEGEPQDSQEVQQSVNSSWSFINSCFLAFYLPFSGAMIPIDNFEMKCEDDTYGIKGLRVFLYITFFKNFDKCLFMGFFIV